MCTFRKVVTSVYVIYNLHVHNVPPGLCDSFTRRLLASLLFYIIIITFQAKFQHRVHAIATPARTPTLHYLPRTLIYISGDEQT